MMSNLNRVHFQVSRSSEYFDAKELQAQTGQPVSNFGDVVLKELLDNALDACESAGVDPVINIGVAATETRIRICVADNGNGMSHAVVSSILDFNTRTSDKAAYKSPTRGAQGNAFKTIIGIPHALGGGLVIIESQGSRHVINATATPAGTIDICTEVITIPHLAGTAVYVDMPRCDIYPDGYAIATAIFNPHAFVKFRYFDDIEFSMLDFEKETDKGCDFYKKLSDLQKIKPNEPTSSHWYSPDDFHKLVYLQGAQRDVPLGDFVRQFKGLSSTGKAKKVARTIPFKRVSDIYKDGAASESLLIAMQRESKPVSPKALGAIGEANMLARLVVDRYWYKQVSGMVDNVPYVFEILIAESSTSGFYFGINHSVAFGDYLSRSRINAGELYGTGIKGSLANVANEDNHIVVAHLIGIGLPFLDRGKSSLSLPSEMVENISNAVWSAAKVLYKEYRARLKDAAKSLRADEARQKEDYVSIKDCVFFVLPDAIQMATDNERLPANVRALYYKVRELIQEYTPKELDYNYFSQNLLIQYWREFGRNNLIYNDPRGILYEPHSNTTLQLGTFSVDRYAFPQHQYNKLLYVEKKGLWHTLEAAKLHKKYDMAIIAGEGYASEAVRILLDKAQTGQNYTIFVLHDADPDGYNILRTIRESTARMPQHNIDVVDLGLTVQDAIDLGISSEQFTRQKELAQDLSLNKIEREFFGGERRIIGNKARWICTRIELNAMSSGQLVDYVDRGISRAIDAKSIVKKVVPPESVLLNKAVEQFRASLAREAELYVTEKLRLNELFTELFGAFPDAFSDQELSPCVNDYLDVNEFKTWNNSIDSVVHQKMVDLDSDIKPVIAELFKKMVAR